MTERIFVSSVQRELAEERRAIRDFIQRDPLMRRFFSVVLFEDLPAADRRADDVYLSEVDGCTIFVSLLGDEYGYEDANGISPTEIALLLDPKLAQHVMNVLSRHIQKLLADGQQPLVLCAPQIRLAFRRFFESTFADLSVLSYAEVPARIEIQSAAMVSSLE